VCVLICQSGWCKEHEQENWLEFPEQKEMKQNKKENLIFACAEEEEEVKVNIVIDKK